MLAVAKANTMIIMSFKGQLIVKFNKDNTPLSNFGWRFKVEMTNVKCQSAVFLHCMK